MSTRRASVFLIVLAVIVWLAGCGTHESPQPPAKQPRTTIAGSTPQADLVRPVFTTTQLLTEAEIYAAAGERERAMALLEILQEKFPDASAAIDAQQLLAKLRVVKQQDHEPTSAKAEPAVPVPITPGSAAPVVSTPEVSRGFITGLIGSRGAANAMSLSAELDRTKGIWLYGAGIAWLQTSDVKTIYYVDSSSADPGVTNLGDSNEGDEYELYGVLGRKIKGRLTAGASVGFSRQTIVNLEQNNATKTLYVASRRTENYLTFSGQVRYQVRSFASAVIGFHTRRGAVGGLSILW